MKWKMSHDSKFWPDRINGSNLTPTQRTQVLASYNWHKDTGPGKKFTTVDDWLAHHTFGFTKAGAGAKFAMKTNPIRFLNVKKFTVKCDGKTFGPYKTRAQAKKAAQSIARVCIKPAAIMGHGTELKANPGKSSKSSSRTRTSTEVRSPTETSTSTSTDAYTAGNVTVTGGAGAGATKVSIHQHKAEESHRGSQRPQRKPWAGVPKVKQVRQSNPISRGAVKLHGMLYDNYRERVIARQSGNHARLDALNAARDKLIKAYKDATGVKLSPNYIPRIKNKKKNCR